MRRDILLPEIDTLKKRMQSLAALDAVVCPDWENRYFSFDKAWALGESLGSIRNGSGDEVFVMRRLAVGPHQG